ncbi:proteasome maturation factor ump1 protein, partial [Cystoisospora suis]
MDYSAALASSSSSGVDSSSSHLVGLPHDFPNTSLYDGMLPPQSSHLPSSFSSSSSSSLLPRPPCAGISRHPLELQQSNYLRSRERMEFRRAASLYGLHAPLRLKMERELTAMTQRLPGLPSSLWGLQTLMRLDEEISVEDYLNVDHPEGNEEERTAGP